MKRRLMVLLGIGLATALGCGKIESLTRPRVTRGSANFATYVALGTSLGAGYNSGGLVERHQRRSYVYQFAEAIGAAGTPTSFTIPSISDSGIPPLLILRRLSPLIITRAATAGSPLNLGQSTSYHNLSVPGALLVDVVDSTLYGRSALFGIIQRHRGTLLQQALGLGPTFLSFEFGVNELLSAATNGSSTLLNPAFEPPTFAAVYTAAMNGIAAGAPGAKLALVNVPDVTTIPFFTTFPPYTLCSGVLTPLRGPNGPLAFNDLVLLTAADSMAIGTGFPVGCASYLTGAPGNGRGLLGSQILDAAETQTIEDYVAAYNAIIDSVATTRGAALVDLNGLLRRAATTGLRLQGTTYNAHFVSGGLFGLDGVHPTDLGYGFLANVMIDAVNAKFGSGIAHVDLAAAATAGRYAARPVDDAAGLPRVVGLDAVLRDLFGEPDELRRVPWLASRRLP